VDLGLFLASGPISGIRSEVLAHEPLALVVAPGHPLAKRRAVANLAVSPLEIVRHPFVTGLRGSRYFDLVDAALRRAGASPYQIAMELQESAAVKEMVRHGTGIACLPACTVRREIAAGDLIELKLTTPLPDLELRCGHRAPLEGATQKLLAALRGAR
jgi:DNA-binding transcriptional LysR family regulator